MIIKVVMADSQYAKLMVPGDVKAPPPATLVTLTAVVVNDDGTPAPKGTKVYWRGDVTGNKVMYYQIDAFGNPIYDPTNEDSPSPTIDKGVSETDALGQATVMMVAVMTMITTIYAYLTPPEGGADAQLAAPPLGGANYQFLAFADFDNKGTLKLPTIDPKGKGGKLQTVVQDGTVEKPPKQKGFMSAKIPLVEGQGPDVNDNYIVWVLSGADETGRGEIVQDITSWDGGDLNVTIPYGYFSGAGNSLAYLFYGKGNPYYSQVYTFDFEGVPLVRPDDGDDFYTTPSLAPVMLQAKYPDLITQKPFITPMDQIITFDDNLDPVTNYLRFAIPAPKGGDGKDSYSPGDIIKVTMWLNGWETDDSGATMQTKILEFPTYSGKNFKPNYGSDGKTYLPFFVPKSMLIGYGARPGGGNGYMWIMYTYNGNNSQLPQQNGTYPTRINFPGPHPDIGSDEARERGWRIR